MSNTVKLSGRLLADEELNGLDSLAPALINDPQTIRFGFVWFDVSDIRDKIDTDERIPTVRVRAFEPVGALSDVPATLQRQAVKLREQRTGKTPLPFNVVSERDQVEDDVSEVEAVDPHAGRRDNVAGVAFIAGGDDDE